MLEQNLGRLKLVIESLKERGFLETLKRIQRHIKNKRNSQVYDLIALKPVKNKWKASNSLQHKYNISVVIPTYNRANLLKELLDSWKKVADITKYSFEIIFSDDGSTDDSLNILRSVKDLPLKLLENKHGGAAKARNAAIMAAEGEKILIIGDDIFPNKNILNQHYEKLKELDITDAVLGECIWHQDLNVNHLMEHITEIGNEQFSFKHFPKHNYTDFRHFYTCNISIDREFLLSEKIIFDELFYKVNYEDIELGYRLAKKGMKVYYYPEANGEHLHAYHDIHKFCIRQETAGEMALVFFQLHEEMDVMLCTQLVVAKWSKYINHPSNLLSKHNIYDELIIFCQFIEDHNDTKDSDLSDDLSSIYGKLFNFAYEKGIFQKKFDIDTELLNNVLVNEFLDEEMIDAIESLYHKRKTPNFDKLSWLLINDSKKNTILTIEVEDQQHLDRLMEHFSGFQNFLQYKFKSEAVFKGFVYKPEKDFFLSKNALKEIILFLQKYKDIDVILLSFGLYDLPKIGLTNKIENNLISRGNYVQDELINLEQNTKGKVIRIFEDVNDNEVELSELTNHKINYLDEYGFFACKQFDSKSIRIELCPFSLEELGNKPVIFVLPTFLAVGGAERNTIEIINKLRTKYDFVVINFERLNQELGSFHYQFISSCKAIYDLTELSEHNDILCYLKALKKVYCPELVWICNGSPWFASNTKAIRDLFYDCAIVDQQVYDEKEGWINIFNDKGIHSFDRFIAINSKIKNEFINGKGIDEAKIDLIHHVVKSERFDRKLYNSRKNELLEKFNIAQNKKNFVFVGRMAEQKRPFLFLEMIALLQKEYKNCNFIMVGDGPFSDDVKEVIDKKDLSIIRRIKFIENVAEIYALVDGLIITSKFEGLPIAMLEAMCMGLPVFATNVGDIDIVLEEYKSGMVVPVNSSASELAEKFIKFEKDLKVYREYAQNSAEKIRNRFSEETVSRNYDRCFQKALNDAND